MRDLRFALHLLLKNPGHTAGRTVAQTDEGLAPSVSLPIVSEAAEAVEGFPIFGAVCRDLAGNNIVGMAHRESLDDDASLPGIRKSLNSVGSEDQVEIEGTIFQLDKVFAPFNLRRLGFRERKSKFTQADH